MLVVVLILIVLAGAVLAPRLLAPPFRGPRMAPCPRSPNCVSSQAPPGGKHVDPLALPADPAEAQARARHAVDWLPRTRIVEDVPGYLRAECRSLVFGFVDDLELSFSPGRVDVRSASRVGHSDFGVNRRRVEIYEACSGTGERVGHACGSRSAEPSLNWCEWTCTPDSG